MGKLSVHAVQTRQERGFTIMEVMIAMVIVAICTAVAVPSYQAYYTKSRRTSAQALLLEIAQRQQQYLLDARAYAADLTTLGVATPTIVSTYYTITMTVASGPPATFTATATPKTGTTQASDSTLTLNNAGVKTPSDKW